MMHKFDRNLEFSNGIETDLVRLLYYDFERPLQDTYYSYESTRLCTIIEGEKDVVINSNQRVIYNPEQFLVLPPSSSVDMEIKGKTKAFVLELNNDVFSKVANSAGIAHFDSLVPKNVIHGKDISMLKDSIDKIIKIEKDGSSQTAFLVDLHIQEIVLNLLQNPELKLSNNFGISSDIADSIEYMKSNLYEEITMRDVSDYIQMSQSSFSNQFKKELGTTPTAYLNGLKMKESKKLLGQFNVTEASLMLGMENISHFIRKFKSFYNVTPKQFQSEQLKNSRSNSGAASFL